jgi:hypothetical protein
VEDSIASETTATADATTVDTESETDSTSFGISEEDFWQEVEDYCPQTDSTSSETSDEEFFQQLEDSKPPANPTSMRSAPWPYVPPLKASNITTTTAKEETDKETLRKESHKDWYDRAIRKKTTT